MEWGRRRLPLSHGHYSVNLESSDVPLTTNSEWCLEVLLILQILLFFGWGFASSAVDQLVC